MMLDPDNIAMARKVFDELGIKPVRNAAAAPWDDDGAPPPAGLEDYGISAPPEIVGPAGQAPGRRISFTSFREIQLSTTARYLVKGILPNVGLVVVWGAP